MRHRALEQARFEHANVIRVYDLVPVQHPESGEVVDGLVMEFVDGLKLGERLRLEMDTVTARALGIGLIDGIAAIHAERAHGDLHDGQVLVRGTEAKIIDLAALTSVGTSHLRRLDDMRAEDLVRLCGFLSDLLFYGAGPDVSSEFRRDVRERSKTPSLKDLRAAFEAATGAPPADPAFAVAVGQARDQLAKKLDTDALATGLRSAVPAQRSAAIDRVAMMAQTRRQVPRQLIELLERGVIDRARPERERTRAIEVLRELRAGQSIRPDMVAEWFSPGTSVALVDAFSTLFRDEPEAVTLLCEALEKADVPKEPDYALIGAIHRALTTIHAVLGQHALDLSVELCRRCLDVARRFVSCEKLAPEVKLIESEVEG
jgi:hypothetical protein